MDDKDQKLEQLKKMMEQWIITLEEYKKEEDKIVNYDKIKEDNKGNIDALIELWVKKFELWEYKETLNICHQILDINNENYIARIWEIYCYYYLWEIELAYSKLNKAEKIYNQDKTISNLEWLICFKKGDYDLALSIFEKNNSSESIINQYILKSRKLWITNTSDSLMWLIWNFIWVIANRMWFWCNEKTKIINEICEAYNPRINTILYLYEHMYWNYRYLKKLNISTYKWYNDYLNNNLSQKTIKNLFEQSKNINEYNWYLFFDKGITDCNDRDWSESRYYFYNKEIWEKEINNFLLLYPNYEEDYKNKKLLDLGLITNWTQLGLLEPIYMFYKNIYAIALATNLHWIPPDIALEYYNKAKLLDNFEDFELLCDILISLNRYDDALKIAIDEKCNDKKIEILEKLNKYEEIIKIYDEKISKYSKKRKVKKERKDMSRDERVRYKFYDDATDEEEVINFLYGEEISELLTKKIETLGKINNNTIQLEFYNNVIKIYSEAEKDSNWYRFLKEFRYNKEDFYYKKAIILKKLSRFQEAIDTLTELLKINPNHTDAELLRNILYKNI